MKGTVTSFFEKQKKAGGSYLNVVMTVDGGNTAQYLCTDENTMKMVRNSINKEMDFVTFPSKDGSATFMSLPKGAGSGGNNVASTQASGAATYAGGYAKRATQESRNESFACAYAKDIVVALIAKGNLESSEGITGALGSLIDFFMTKLNTTK